MEPKEGDPELRYYISSSKNKPIDLSVLVRNKKEDPAYKVNFFTNYFENVSSFVLPEIHPKTPRPPTRTSC